MFHHVNGLGALCKKLRDLLGNGVKILIIIIVITVIIIIASVSEHVFFMEN